MNLIFKRDLLDVNWQQITEVYQAALSPHADLAGVKAEFERSDLACFAIVDDRIVGGAHAITDGRDAAIYGVAVHPDFQSQGIGTQMVPELLRDLKGVSVILNAGPQSQSLYRRLGFRPLKYAMALRYSDDAYAD